MKTYSEYINESKQIGDVYHFTSFDAMLHIMKTDILRAYTMSSAVFHALHGTSRTISTTRDKNYVNARSHLSISGDVVLVLDGDKLATKYKRRPVDDRYDVRNKKILDLNYGISKDTGIKDIKKYIKKIVFTKNFINYVKITRPSTIIDDIKMQMTQPTDTLQMELRTVSTQKKLEAIAKFLQDIYNIPFEVPVIKPTKPSKYDYIDKIRALSN